MLWRGVGDTGGPRGTRGPTGGRSPSRPRAARRGHAGGVDAVAASLSHTDAGPGPGELAPDPASRASPVHARGPRPAGAWRAPRGDPGGPRDARGVALRDSRGPGAGRDRGDSLPALRPGLGRSLPARRWSPGRPPRGDPGPWGRAPARGRSAGTPGGAHGPRDAAHAPAGPPTGRHTPVPSAAPGPPSATGRPSPEIAPPRPPGTPQAALSRLAPLPSGKPGPSPTNPTPAAAPRLCHLGSRSPDRLYTGGGVSPWTPAGRGGRTPRPPDGRGDPRGADRRRVPRPGSLPSRVGGRGSVGAQAADLAWPGLADNCHHQDRDRETERQRERERGPPARLRASPTRAGEPVGGRGTRGRVDGGPRV